MPDVLFLVFVHVHPANNTHQMHRPYSPLPAPGNCSSRFPLNFETCGQFSDCRIGFSTSVNLPTACNTFPTRPLRMSGEPMLMNCIAKHTKLLPSRSVCALNTPPVKSSRSTPTKVLGSPVLPPTRIRSGYLRTASRASRLRPTRP